MHEALNESVYERAGKEKKGGRLPPWKTFVANPGSPMTTTNVEMWRTKKQADVGSPGAQLKSMERGANKLVGLYQE